jgi:hypothetical protein
MLEFSDKARYFSCFNHYRKNNGNYSQMTELVAEYAASELRRYIDITEMSHQLRGEHNA